MSEENIEIITKSDSNFSPTFVDYHVLPDIKSNGNCFVNNTISLKSYKYTYYILRITHIVNINITP